MFDKDPIPTPISCRVDMGTWVKLNVTGKLGEIGGSGHHKFKYCLLLLASHLPTYLITGSHIDVSLEGASIGRLM